MTYRLDLSILALVLVSFAVLFAVPVPASAATINGTSISIKYKAPECRVRVTNSRIRSGDTTTITWRSENALSMNLFKKDRPASASGKTRVAFAVPGKFEIPIAFTGPGGEVTCRAVVHVRERADKRR